MKSKNLDDFESKLEEAKKIYFLLNEFTINKKPAKNEGYKTQAY